MLRTVKVGIGALLLSVSLNACLLELPGNDLSGPLKVEQQEFQQIGGTHCQNNTTSCARLQVSYPQVLAAANPAAVPVINAFIQEQLLEYSDPDGKQPSDFPTFAKLFIADYDSIPDNQGNWELERRMEVVFSNDYIATLRLSESGYTGGAHPFSGLQYFIIDLFSGKPLTLNDLLAPDYPAVLNTAGEQAFRQERRLAENMPLDAAGFWFPNNVFQLNTNVGVTRKGLVFNFNPYEVAPYAMGATEFSIPFSAIASVIPAQSPLAELAR